MTDPAIHRAERAVKELFGFSGLRPLQREVLGPVFEGQDTLAILATGGGKSLLFILPGLVLPGITIVVSPLLALMADQVKKLQAQGVPAVALTSTMRESEHREALSDLSQFNLVYVSPEKAVTREFLKALRGVQVSLIAVDESHAIASLYSTFRASCAHLGDLFDQHEEAVRLAVTATADPAIEEDIHRICHLRDPARIVSSPWRENILWTFEKDAEEESLVEMISSAQEKDGRQIVYVSSRRSAVEVAQTLEHSGLSAAPYHAGMTDTLRKMNQERFMSYDVRCMVATSAFGMGIDAPDIRLVANWQLPATLYDLLQQGGRCSRDGEAATCWTNLGSDAEKTQRYFQLLTHPEFPVYRKLWDAFSKQDGPTRWRGDILLRIAGVGDKLAGQLSSAMSYLEYRRQIRTTPAGEVYVLPVLDNAKAARLCAGIKGATLDRKRNTVVYFVGRESVDHSQAFIASRACAHADPLDTVIVDRLTDTLEITSEDIAARRERSEDSFHAIYEFAKAADKRAFIESMFSR